MKSATHKKQVAVLGGGILGCCTALCLVEKGFHVALFDQECEPMMGASRWNEGKIHLGYLYSASGGLETAQRVFPGGLLFKSIMERLLETSLSRFASQTGDIYLFHKDSAAPPAASMAYCRQVTDLIVQHPFAQRYFLPVSQNPVRVLEQSECEELADPRFIEGGVQVPEVSLHTQPLADLLVNRVINEPRIEIHMSRRVRKLHKTEGGRWDSWQVISEFDKFGPYGFVVNALWAGRPELDQLTIGKTDSRTHHRYRVSAFVRSGEIADHPSVTVAAGPFGDIKNYDGRHFYISWYPVCLLAQGERIIPPDTPVLSPAEKAALAAEIETGLASVLPGVRQVFELAEHVLIEGGWVYAQATGHLKDPISSLHRRNLPGVYRFGSYLTVDTGKFSMAPYLAEEVAKLIAST